MKSPLISAFLDAELRAKQYHLDSDQQDGSMHRILPFREFIEEGINNPSFCGNCLDSPGLRAEVPPFIMRVVMCWFFICCELTST